MNYTKSHNLTQPVSGSPNFLLGIALLWGVVALAVFVFFLTAVGFDDPMSRLYLVPWALAAGVVIILPTFYLIKKGRFDLFNPLVFAAWSYFFPAFVIGGMVLAAGLTQPYFLSYIQDDTYNLPLTFVYVIAGYAGLSLGFFIPFGRSIGNWIYSKLPDWNWSEESIPLPGMILLVLGLANTLLAFVFGIVGFQKVDEIGAFDGIIFLLSLFLLEASFLLWVFIFRSNSFTIVHYAIMATLILIAMGRSLFQGNRGSLIQFLILFGAAFIFSGKKITSKHYMTGGVLVCVALVVGMIYGTTFRQIKGSQERASITEIGSLVADTFDNLASGNFDANLSTGFVAIAERLDTLSSLAVIVSNHEALAPYEELWGIDNNIWVDTITFFVPRVIWADKPIPIDTSKYSDLYFNYSENAFAMTPIGDLLRNFGPYSIPIGMMILGFILRIIYSSLVENKPFSYWRVTLFFMLLSSVSYEGTYGLIIPYLFKVMVVSVLGILIIRLIVGRTPSGNKIFRSFSR